ncbi:MAG TPA: DNA-processing protein DprA [Flavitalea sp.]|nr:DNA-processing protein DprA [Flavitalea sp.]
MNVQEDLLFQISLLHIPNIGAVHAKTLIDKFGSARNIFHAPVKLLESLEGIGHARARNIRKFNDFGKAEKEIRFIEKFKIKALFITDPLYPTRLLNCYDPPTMIFFKGPADLNHQKIVSIVGTRKNSDYGKAITERIVRDLATFQPIITSGLAFGIDTIAHKAAIKNQLPTVAVLAHGLHTIYPFDNASLAREIVLSGGLLSEFPSGTDPDKHNFPSRNRVVAGLSDAVIVIETGQKGGSMITAELGNSYHRDVFAVPGRTTDPKSEGCNFLIQNNKAVLLNDGMELAEALGWMEKEIQKPVKQTELFVTLSEDEKRVFEIINESDGIHVDQLMGKSALSTSRFASIILNLEIHNLIITLPGKVYKTAH